jgi:16S rRNA (cytosine1402-N4)-methyltransferase
VLSYHSLEDRIVKNSFKRLSAEGRLNIITKKPLSPGSEEIRRNPSSRSAKFRAAEAL